MYFFDINFESRDAATVARYRMDADRCCSGSSFAPPTPSVSYIVGLFGGEAITCVM